MSTHRHHPTDSQEVYRICWVVGEGRCTLASLALSSSYPIQGSSEYRPKLLPRASLTEMKAAAGSFQRSSSF